MTRLLKLGVFGFAVLSMSELCCKKMNLKSIVTKLVATIESADVGARKDLADLLLAWQNWLDTYGIRSEPALIKSAILNLKDNKNIKNAKQRLMDMAASASTDGSINARIEELRGKGQFGAATKLESYVLPVVNAAVKSLS